MNLLTDDQLERAARMYCELAKMDPDERVQHGHPEGYAVALYSPRWRLVAAEIRDHELKAMCVDTVRDHG